MELCKLGSGLIQINKIHQGSHYPYPVDNFGTVVGENPTPYGILALWAVNSLSIVYWVLICINPNPNLHSSINPLLIPLMLLIY